MGRADPRGPVAAVRPASVCLLVLLLCCTAGAQAWDLVADSGHSMPVTALAASPDGRILASGAMDRSIRLWSLEGRLIRVLRGHAGIVSGVAFHPSGVLLASIGQDDTLRLWDLDGTELWSRVTDANGSQWHPDAVAVTRDRIWYTTAGWAVPVDLDGNKGTPVMIRGGPARWPSATVDDKGQPWFATTRSLFDPVADTALPDLPEAFHGEITSVDADRGRFVVGSFQGCVAVWEGAAGTGAWRLLEGCEAGDGTVHLENPQRVTGTLFLPDGAGAMAVHAGGTVQILDAALALASSQQLDFPIDLGPAIALPVRDGQGGYVLSAGSFLFAATEDLRVRPFAGAPTCYTAAEFAPGDAVWALGTCGGRIELWRRDGSMLLSFQAHDGPIRNLRWHRGGLLVSQTARELAVWKPDGTEVMRRQMLTAGNGALRWKDSEQATLLVSGGVSGRYDLTGGGMGTPRTPADFAAAFGETPASIVLAADGTTYGLGEQGDLLVQAADGTVTHLALPEAQRIPGPENSLLAAAGLPDGAHLALDGAGRLLHWRADGTLDWTRASYRPESFRSGLFTEGQLERLCRARAQIALDPDAEHERCVADPDLRRFLRDLPAPGVFDADAWRDSVTGMTPAMFWSPEDPLVVSADGGEIATASWDGTVTVWSPDGTRLAQHHLHDEQVTALDFSSDGRWLLSVANGATAALLDVRSGHAIEMTGNGSDWITWNPEGRFTASRGGARLISVSGRTSAHAVDQFAAALNDPAAVLEPLGLIDEARARHYRAARALRYRRLGAAAEVRPDGLPVARLLDVRKDGDVAHVRARVEAGDAPLAAWQLWVDDVPRFPDAGRAVTASDGSVDVEADVDLLDGHNRIEVSAIDAGGVESVRAVSDVLARVDEHPALWFVGIGVSDYQLDWLPKLNFAAKDAGDLAQAFGTLGDRFSAVHLRTWLDDDVDADAFRDAHSFLARAAPDDLVVMFIAGHGTYAPDDAAQFYYLLPKSDQHDMADTAISFEQAEGALYGLQSRRKLMLIDTCQSGEPVGPQELARYDAAVQAGLIPRVPRPKLDPSAPAPQGRHWLRQRDRFIYADLARRSGAVVFSSAKGNEFSNEAAYLKNGFFTQGILLALSDPAADADGDGELSVQELFDSVSAFVQQESTLDEDEGPTQNPTIDRDNLSARFEVPLIPQAERGRFARDE